MDDLWQKIYMFSSKEKKQKIIVFLTKKIIWNKNIKR